MRAWLRTEDAWALLIGLGLTALSALSLLGLDAFGWVVKANEWVAPGQAMTPATLGYAGLPGPACLALTFVFVLAVLSVGAWAMGVNLRRFALAFTAVFALSYLSWLIGHNAYIAATTPAARQKFGISGSLGLTGEAGFIVALLAGLVIGNFFPAAARWLQEAARPEWFIKTGIIILGAALGIKAAGATRLIETILFRGLAAIVEAYLIYWALVYFVARRFFGFSREWAAPLASGISICGVSAAITTGAAIRARPVVPVLVSSLVVVFSVVELILLPLAARTWLADEPMVAAAWMGLAVKTDGAAVSSGAITQAYFAARAEADGVPFPQKDLMMLTTTTVKVFIDLFIGVWAFVLALVWAYAIDRKPGRGVPLADIWNRFPKFVFGYFLAFAVLLAVGSAYPHLVATGKPAGPLARGVGQIDLFRGIFFVMTFFSIGLASNFKKLWAEGLARLALVYVVCLFGFVIWIGLVISWLFFHGYMPYPPTGGA
jgi:uncharacterized membrane protein YadS